ncbi:autotransporter adhesin BpaC-like [Ptychodera flava]|uniref:autotransporter adhesin BpaC-like n=1 Tax=Ptychodera flava TaxID=63121 RepID=UPI00396A3AB7
MSIREVFPLRKRRSSFGEKTPRRRARFLLGKTPCSSLNESMNSSFDGEPEITWDNNSPSPMKCTRLATRLRNKGQQVSDVSEIVKRITAPCSSTEESTSTGRPGTPTLLGVWMRKDGRLGSESTAVTVKSDNVKPINQTPVRRRNKRKVSSGKPVGIRSSQVTKYMKKLIEETEAQELKNKGEDKQDIALDRVLPTESKTKQSSSHPVVIEISDDNNELDLERGNVQPDNSKQIQDNPNSSMDLFAESPPNTSVNKQKLARSVEKPQDLQHKEKEENIHSLKAQLGKTESKDEVRDKSGNQNISYQDDLWDDDDLFCDDSFIRQATQIEIQCSQVKDKKVEIEDLNMNGINGKLTTSTPLIKKTDNRVSARANDVSGNMNYGSKGSKSVISTMVNLQKTSQFSANSSNSIAMKNQRTMPVSKSNQQLPQSGTTMQGKTAMFTNKDQQHQVTGTAMQNQTARDKIPLKPLTGKALNATRIQTKHEATSVNATATQGSKNSSQQFLQRNSTTKSRLGSKNNNLQPSVPSDGNVNVGIRHSPFGDCTGPVKSNKQVPGQTTVKINQPTNNKYTGCLHSKGNQNNLEPSVPKASGIGNSQGATVKTLQPLKSTPKIDQLTITAKVETKGSSSSTQSGIKATRNSDTAIAENHHYDLDISLNKDDLLELLEQDWSSEESITSDTNMATETRSKTVNSGNVTLSKTGQEKLGVDSDKLALSHSNSVTAAKSAESMTKGKINLVHVNRQPIATCTRSGTTSKPQFLPSNSISSKGVSVTSVNSKPLGDNNGKSQLNINANQTAVLKKDNMLTAGKTGECRNNGHKEENGKDDKTAMSNSQGESSSQRCSPEEIERKKKEALQRRQQKMKLSQPTQTNRHIQTSEFQPSSVSTNSKNQRKYSFRQLKSKSK